MLDEKEIIETLENLAVDKYIDERKLEEKDVEAIINIIVLYKQEKEKNKKARYYIYDALNNDDIINVGIDDMKIILDMLEE